MSVERANRRNRAIPWVAALLATGCGGGAARELPADAPPAAREAVEACRSLTGDEKQGCYERRLLARLDEAGVPEALATLEAIAAADVDVERDGHVYTHAIGIESYDPEKPVTDAFGRCTALFQSGCYHGVIQAHFVASGEITEPVVRELCRPYKGGENGVGGDRWLLFQCLHGMGHGLTMVHDHHLPRALESCDLLASQWDRSSCYGGAFMENIMYATSPHHPTS
ncbi:MAG: hypothetical protein ACRELC_11130, partial [Gemmatimonadota bacterium]